MTKSHLFEWLFKRNDSVLAVSGTDQGLELTTLKQQKALWGTTARSLGPVSVQLCLCPLSILKLALQAEINESPVGPVCGQDKISRHLSLSSSVSTCQWIMTQPVCQLVTVSTSLSVNNWQLVSTTIKLAGPGTYMSLPTVKSKWQTEVTFSNQFGGWNLCKTWHLELEGLDVLHNTHFMFYTMATFAMYQKTQGIWQVQVYNS